MIVVQFQFERRLMRAIDRVTTASDHTSDFDLEIDSHGPITLRSRDVGRLSITGARLEVGFRFHDDPTECLGVRAKPSYLLRQLASIRPSCLDVPPGPILESAGKRVGFELNSAMNVNMHAPACPAKHNVGSRG
jgi:hypothetical protein